ncbi:MAG: hypothetical protein ACW98X_26155, partial [Promethearchaeota archaeon]
MKRFLEPIAEEIIRWSSILVVTSFIFSIISILLTNNISQGSNFSLRLFARTMSNFTFYLGTISIAIGLIFTFFKAPEINKSQRLVKPKFKPKYHNKKLETSNTFPIIK